MDSLHSGVANKTFKNLFKNNIQFEVPFFQRKYSWEKKHWDQLFDDVEEQVLSHTDTGQDLEDIELFFGPIVVLEKLSPDLELKRFLIIDGQQRITTVYLLLAIARKLLRERSYESQQASLHVQALDRFLENDVDGRDDYRRLKVYSSKGDRLPTFYAVFGRNANPQSPYFQIDQQMYIPGRNNVDAFVKYAEKKLRKSYSSVPALWELAQAFLRSLKVVWIS